MPKTKLPKTHDELAELNLKLMQDNATLIVLLEQSAVFARRQAQALDGITQMARVLTRNKGLAKDRARLAAAVQVLSKDCTAEAKTQIDSLVAVSALQWPTGTQGDRLHSPGLFMMPGTVQ